MNYAPIQLKLPVDLENIIEINDAVYAFNEVVSHIDLKKYFVEKDYKATGRPRYEREKLLKVLLFAFMEQGYPSLREIEKLCKVDIRFIWLRDEMKAPSYATLCDFINQELSCSLEGIIQEINSYIFTQENVDIDHVYWFAHALLPEIEINCFRFSTFDDKTPFQLPSNEVFQEITRYFSTYFFGIWLLNRDFLRSYGQSSHKYCPEQLLDGFSQRRIHRLKKALLCLLLGKVIPIGIHRIDYKPAHGFLLAVQDFICPSGFRLVEIQADFDISDVSAHFSPFPR